MSSQSLLDQGRILALPFPQHLTIAGAVFSSTPCSVSFALEPYSVLCLTQHH